MDLGGLYKKILDNNIPLFGCLEVTTACNNGCVHCYNVGRDTLSLELVKKSIDGMADLGTLFLSITGGEPMTRTDIWEILEYAVDKDFATLLYTNATLIGSREAARLKDLGIYHVDTTLLGDNPGTHDAISRSKGSFVRTMAALHFLREQGVNVAVKTPVMRENVKEIDNISSVMEKMGIQHIASPLMFSKDDGTQAPLSHRISNDDMKRFFLKRDVTSLTDPNGGYPCHMGICTFAVRANGDVHPCISVPLKAGNVGESSLKDIWYNSKELSHIRSNRGRIVNGCNKCDVKGWCFRCEGIALLESGSLFMPAEELCRMANIRKEVGLEKH
jgi:radical SAM protein with 4Fe4S-binding SPASM domain